MCEKCRMFTLFYLGIHIGSSTRRSLPDRWPIDASELYVVLQGGLDESVAGGARCTLRMPYRSVGEGSSSVLADSR